MVLAHAELERLLLGGVVERERTRLGLAVVVAGQRLDDDRHLRDRVEYLPASLRGATDRDAVNGPVAGAVAGDDGVGLLPSR